MAKKATAVAEKQEITSDDVATVASITEAAAQAFKERAEADFDPAETAAARLARLEAETKETLKAARAEVRKEKKAETEKTFKATVGPKLEKVAELLAEIEQETGQIFRHFSYLYKNPKGAEKPEIKIRHTMVSPRGESTED